jgi:nucleoside 2-deoxyribosyltransferase
MARPSSVRRGREKSRTRMRSCFIAASSRTDLKTIESLLREKGLKPVIVSELTEKGAPIAEYVTSAISKTDLTIAVLDKEQSNENVCFELGVARGLGKQLLVIAPPGIRLPMDLGRMLSLRTDPKNREAIDFALDQVLAVAERPTRQLRNWTGERTRPIGNLARKLITHLESLGDSVTENDVKEIVTSALKASGSSVVVQSGIRDTLVDMAVWSDELHPWTGNPLPIEIKKRLSDRDQILASVRQLSHYLQGVSAYWALVLYVEGPQSIDEMSVSDVHGSTVLFLRVQELLERMRTNSFVDVMIRLRNQRLHGAND